jgi:dihydrofolate reductase
MRKLIASINMTLDGYCDHTAVDPDDDVHRHYENLLRDAGVLLYGRITYQLMEFWRTLVANPSGNKTMDDFALAMDQTPKIVFSHTLKETGWASAILADQSPEETIAKLKQQPGKDIYAGSPGLIAYLMQAGLVDELQLCVHPVIVGSGLVLFKSITDKISLKLLKTKTFSSGAIILYYEPVKT